MREQTQKQLNILKYLQEEKRKEEQKALEKRCDKRNRRDYGSEYWRY